MAGRIKDTPTTQTGKTEWKIVWIHGKKKKEHMCMQFSAVKINLIKAIYVI